MVKVAIAGGTSPTLGKSLVEAILATKKHDVIILSRQPETPVGTKNTGSSSSKYNAPIIPVNYDSIADLTHTLRSQDVDTLISVLKINDQETMIAYHKNLLSAAESARVSRFVLSDWSLAPPAHSRVDLLANKAALHSLGRKHMSHKHDHEHTVECCTIQPGGFLEYFAQGCGRPDIEAGLDDDLMLEYIDVKNGRIVVPLSSSSFTAEGKREPQPDPAIVTMTSLVDIGRFVAAALDLPRGKLMGQIGIAGCNVVYTTVIDCLNAIRPDADRIVPRYITKKECDAVAEEKGKVFQEKMGKSGEVDVDALKSRLAAQLMSCLCEGTEGGGLVTGTTLNDLCPEVKPVDLTDFLKRAWSDI